MTTEDIKAIEELLEACGICDYGSVEISEIPTLAIRALIQEREELLAAIRFARIACTNQRYNKPRIGMEHECEVFDSILARTALGETK